MSRAAIAVLALATLGACATTPRADRNWYPYLSHTAHVEAGEASFSVSPVTDWSYTASGPTANTYVDAAYDYAALRDVWFVLEPQPGSKIAAHTFLMFEFGNASGEHLIGLTIEARREANESYSAVRGAFNAYELSYLWGTAHDLLTRRAVMLGHDVYIYPLILKPEAKVALLRHVLTRTAALEAHPRFYNTLTSNCTNELAKATNLHWHTSFILTGTADNHLYHLGLIPGESFAAAEQRAHLTDFIKELNARPAAEFDRLLLERLRQGASAP